MFLHGGGVSGWMWKNQINDFQHFHCLVPDLPEQGGSRECGLFSINGSAHLLLETLEKKAKGKKVILIGFSLGAQIVVQMISMKPELIDYAMINSALVRPILFSKMYLKFFLNLSYPLIKNKTFSSIQAKTLFIHHDDFPIYYKESCEMEKETLMRILKENMSYTIPNQFQYANVNILVTVGEKENSIMKKSAYDLVLANQLCQGIVIKNVGHGISLANPTLFREIIENWLGTTEFSSHFFKKIEREIV